MSGGRAGSNRAVGALVALTVSLWATVCSAQASHYAIRNVTIVDVETGSHRAHQTVVVDGDTVLSVSDAASAETPLGAMEIDGTGYFLIPGLWDMHVHSHRAQRWTYHYPLFRAFGVVGVRDSGTHLGSALAWRGRAVADPLAPHVIWGSPIIDGAPQVNSFGLSAEDEAAGRALVGEMHRLGFDFIKVYDRLTPQAYHGITDEAARRGVRVEGHVPLALSPQEVVEAGQTLIDHLTLVLEACIPGAIEAVHNANAAAPDAVDSLDLLMDDRLAASVGAYDDGQCAALFDQFARHEVWQVPTLIETRGYFHADDPAVTNDVRTAWVPAALLADWRAWGAEADPAKLANGRTVLAAQMRMIRDMQDHGVGLLTGTDASSEPWVFAGSSVHDELALFVEAGLTPAEALRTATLNPMTYQRRRLQAPLISAGERADLVLLEADPLADIGATRRIVAVFARGQYHDRAALDELLVRARSAAASLP